MAITASFSPSAGAVSLKGGQPSVADTRGIQAFSPGGDDASFLDESNSALPPARLFAHLGYDVPTGGSGSDQFFGRYCGGRHNG